MHLEDLRRTPGAFDDPVGPLQRADDVSALRRLEGGSEPRSRGLVEEPAGLHAALNRPGPDASRGGKEIPVQLQHRTLREHDGPLDDVLQLPDVPRPWVAYEPIHRFRGDRVDPAA